MTQELEQQQQTGRIFVSPDRSLVTTKDWDSLGHYIIDRLTNVHPNVPLFIDYSSGRVWKGLELKEKILNVAAGLVDLYDFKMGTAACMSYDTSDLSFILALGVIVAGGIVACAYPRDPYAELLYLARKVEPRFLFCHERNMHWAKRIETDLGYHVQAIAMGELDASSTKQRPFRHFEELFNYDRHSGAQLEQLPRPCKQDISRQVALITMSSGTTGRPKAVPVTHWNCIAESSVHRRLPPGGPQIHMACCASLDYVSGRIIAFGAFDVGYTAVIMNGFEPATMLACIERYKIHIIYLGAASFYNLITHEDIERYDISSVRAVFPMGAKIIYLDELRQFFAKHPHIKEVKQGFGSSETSGGAMRGCTPAEFIADSENCGRLLRGVQAKIVEPKTGRLLGVNQTGIIHLKGETIFPGYYDAEQARLNKQRAINNNNDDDDVNDDESKQTDEATPFVANSEVFDEDGFYITGDLGYFNDKEELYMLGRQKELMSCRGAKKVLPQELEEVIGEHRDVFKVCVLGVPNKRELTLHCPRAFVVPKRACYDANFTLTTTTTTTTTTTRPKQSGQSEIDQHDHEEPLTYSGNNRLCTMAHSRQLASQLMEFVNDRVGWEKQLTGGIVLLDEIPTSRATGKMDKNYLRSLTTDSIEIYGDRSG